MNILRSIFKNSSSASASGAKAAEPAISTREARILLVGDDFAWLGETRSLAGRKVVRAGSVDEAITLLGLQTFDGVLAGFRDLSKGAALLNAATSMRPSLTCALRADPSAVGKLSISFPVLPCSDSVEVMDDLLHTMFATAQWSRDPALAVVMDYIKKFPALPSLYSQITAALNDETAPVEGISDLISHEPTVSAKLLQLVNSPQFGLRQKVTSIRDAAGFLGYQRLRALVLATSLFGQCDASKCRSFSAAAFENRSMQIASWASMIAMDETGNKRLAEMAFTAGLLHQFGVLLLAANLPDGYDQVLRIAGEQRIGIARVERETYGVTHAELAGFILASWNIPFPIVNAVGWHATPSESEDISFSPLTAVHVATSIDSFQNTGLQDFDRDYLEKIAFLPQLEEWSLRLTGNAWKE